MVPSWLPGSFLESVFPQTDPNNELPAWQNSTSKYFKQRVERNDVSGSTINSDCLEKRLYIRKEWDLNLHRKGKTNEGGFWVTGFRVCTYFWGVEYGDVISIKGRFSQEKCARARSTKCKELSQASGLLSAPSYLWAYEIPRTPDITTLTFWCHQLLKHPFHCILQT